METQQVVKFDKLHLSGMPHNAAAKSNLGRDRADGAKLPAVPQPHSTEPMQMSLREAVLGTSVSSVSDPESSTISPSESSRASK